MEKERLDQIKLELRSAGVVPFIWSASDVTRDWNCSESEALEVLEFLEDLEYFQECVFDFITAVCLDREIKRK